MERERAGASVHTVILICQKGKNTHVRTHKVLNSRAQLHHSDEHWEGAGFYTAGLALIGPRCAGVSMPILINLNKSGKKILFFKIINNYSFRGNWNKMLCVLRKLD